MRAGIIRGIVGVAIAACIASTSSSAMEGAAQSRDPQLALGPGGNSTAGTGMIAGTVVAADTGKPLRRSRVNLSAVDPRIGKSAITDDQGRFSFSELPPADYDLSASRTGFIDMAYGQRRPGIYQQGVAIHLVAKQQINNISVALPRGSVITGMIVDDVGDPAMATQVRALKYVLRNGERALISQGTGTADDRGIYRIPSLPPGDYVVMAVPRDTDDARMESMMRAEQTVVAAKEASMVNDAAMQAKMADAMKQANMAMSGLGPDTEKDPAPGYAPVYYPGTTIGTNATTVTLGVSEERTSINLQLSLVPMARITGIVTNPDGTPAGGASLQLIDSTQALPGMNIRTARSGQDGRFGFTSLPPGQYTVIARFDVRKGGLEMEKASMAAADMKLPPAAKEMAKDAIKSLPPQTFWATTDVGINGRNVLNLALPLRAGMSVAGGLTFEGSAPRPDLTRVRVQLTSTGTATTEGFNGTVDPNGGFTIAGGVPPGKYRVVVSGTGAYKLASALVGGRDALDTLLEIKPEENIGGIDVKLSDKSTAIAGTLQGPGGQPTADYTVVMFPIDQRFWTPGSRRIQGARPISDGTFSIRDLPPGDYRIGAVLDVEAGQWFDPAFLKQLLGASIQFTLGEGERRTQDLRVAR